MKFTKNIGMLLLSVWLIVTGLMALVPAYCFRGGQIAGHSRHRRWRVYLNRPLNRKRFLLRQQRESVFSGRFPTCATVADRGACGPGAPAIF